MKVADRGGAPGFWETNVWVRLLLGVGFALCLWAFLHFQQVRLEVLEVGTSAPRYVVADVDFIFIDDEATVLQRQEAVRDVGRIYSLTGKEVTAAQKTFEQFLSDNQKWREEAKQATFQEMYQATDLFTTQLSRERFTDPRTLKKMRRVGLETTDYYVFTPADPTQPVQLPKEFWQQVGEIAFQGSKVPPTAAIFIANWFGEKQWGLSEDRAAMTAIRDQAQRAVPPVNSSVGAGDRIIDKGETVTARHAAMLKAMNEQLQERRNLWSASTLLGSILLTLVLSAIGAAFLRTYYFEIFSSNKRLFLVLAILVLTLGLAKAIEYLLLRSSPTISDAVHYPLFVPFAAILLCSLLNARLAAYASTFLAVVLTLGLPHNGVGFLIINLLAALVAILSTRTLRKRKEVFVICGKAWICCFLLLLAFHLYSHSFWSLSLLGDLISTLVFLLFTAVVVVGLLPILESFFRIVTEITLMEYMDPTHPLLRRLSIEAPGTYQHSIVVGNLAEVAAIAIGANGLFCRVATLYHDIGKLISPQYFTENQQGGVNIHQLLTPQESAQVIMAHVTEGVTLARKHGLPERFIDIIREHHGTTLVYYFYHQQVQQCGGDASQVDQETFRYKGPKPRSKESGIIMIADTLEAASRALDAPTEEKVRALVEQLVREKMDAGQFDNCLLTFEDMEKVKQSMVTSLVAASHTRIKYPERTPPAGHADDPALPEES